MKGLATEQIYSCSEYSANAAWDSTLGLGYM
jgi:hypothetical protein